MRRLLAFTVSLSVSIIPSKQACWLWLCVVAFPAAPATEAVSEAHEAHGHPRREAGTDSHRPWVWEINGPRSKIWIAGCLHLGTGRDPAVFPAYLPYYRKAEVVYFETIPGSWDSFEIRRLLDRRGFVPDRHSLSSRISPSAWQEFRSALSSSPEKLARYSAMEPWLAAFNLTQDAYAQAGLKAENSLQGYIEHRAAEDRKPVGALESPKDQILAMADASPRDQEEFLRATVQGRDKIEFQTQQLREAWASGDEARLQAVLGLASTPLRSGIHENLIDQRNRRWISKIQEIERAGKNAFIVVGVEHLVSIPHALPDLLEQAGYSIHRTSSGN